MTKYHPKKRIDIDFEAPPMRTLTSSLDQAGVSGYSVLPIVEGRGMLNAWSSAGQIGDAANLMAWLCIVAIADADELVDAVFAAIRDRVGVVVLRPQRL